MWAVVTFALFACIGEMVPATYGPTQAVIGAFADILLDVLRSAGPLLVCGVLVAVSATTGAVMGLVAGQLRSGVVVRRVVVLAVAALPAIWVVFGATWALAWLPHLIIDAPTKLLWVPAGVIAYATIGVVVAAPVLVVPAVLAVVLLEGWTRPQTLPQTGLARPEARRWLLRGLVAAATALTTFAALNWWRVGASP